MMHDKDHAIPMNQRVNKVLALEDHLPERQALRAREVDVGSRSPVSQALVRGLGVPSCFVPSQ